MWLTIFQSIFNNFITQLQDIINKFFTLLHRYNVYSLLTFTRYSVSSYFNVFNLLNWITLRMSLSTDINIYTDSLDSTSSFFHPSIFLHIQTFFLAICVNMRWNGTCIYRKYNAMAWKWMEIKSRVLIYRLSNMINRHPYRTKMKN